MSEIDHHIRTVRRCAIGSRILLLTLIILWRSMFSPYDTSASINPSCLAVSSESPDSAIRFPWIASAIEESIVWDSVYFVRIAQCGYEYEQTYAFLPLLPIVISFVSKTGSLLCSLIFNPPLPHFVCYYCWCECITLCF